MSREETAREVTAPLAGVTIVRLMDGRQVKDETGWGLRIGAGGTPPAESGWRA